MQTFEADWERREPEAKQRSRAQTKASKGTLKALVEELSPLNPIVEEAVRERVEEMVMESMEAS